MVNGYRLSYVSKCTGIHPKQLQRWCQNGDFIPECPIKKSSRGIKSNEQHYSVNDLKRLHIIALFQLVSNIHISEINRLLNGIWNNDSKIFDLFFEILEQRKEYLFKLNTIINTILSTGIENVFNAYTSLMIKYNNEVDKSKRIHKVITELASSDFAQVIDCPISFDKFSFSEASKFTGIDRRTLYRLFHSLNIKNSNVTHQTNYYMFFLISLMRQINPGKYKIHDMFTYHNGDLSLKSAIYDLNEAVNENLFILVGLEKSQKELRKLGFFLISTFTERIIYPDEELTFKNMLYRFGCLSALEDKSIFLLLDSQLLKTGSMSKENIDNFIKYAKELLSYYTKIENETRNEFPNKLSIDTHNSNDIVLCCFITAVHLYFEKSNLCKQLIGCVQEKTDDLSVFLSKLLALGIDNDFEDGSILKIYMICACYISVPSLVDATHSFIKKIKKMTPNTGILNVQKTLIQQETAIFINSMPLSTKEDIINVIIALSLFLEIDQTITTHAIDAINYYFTYQKGEDHYEQKNIN